MSAHPVLIPASFHPGPSDHPDAPAALAAQRAMTPSASVVEVSRLPAGSRGPATAFEFLRYFAASAVALGADIGLYAATLKMGLPYAAAAVLGFAAGAALAYVASVCWVFESRSVRNASLEFGVFLGVGVAGLLLTEGLLWLLIDRLAAPPVWSKLGASAIVFVFNFSLRKVLLFRGAVR